MRSKVQSIFAVVCGAFASLASAQLADPRTLTKEELAQRITRGSPAVLETSWSSNGWKYGGQYLTVGGDCSITVGLWIESPSGARVDQVSLGSLRTLRVLHEERGQNRWEAVLDIPMKGEPGKMVVPATVRVTSVQRGEERVKMAQLISISMKPGVEVLVNDLNAMSDKCGAAKDPR